MPSPASHVRIDPEHLATLHAIDAAVTAATGHEAFPEAMWSAADRADDTNRLVISSDGSTAVFSAASDSFQPSHRQLFVGARADATPGIMSETVANTLSIERADFRSDALVAWLPGSDQRFVTALAEHGFVIDRQQHQMRVALPLTDPITWPAGVAIHPFRPGLDETAWLNVNNRAFLNHPDQGGWIAEVLTRRMAEPWFDPAGFLLAWRGGDLLGFCWTKVHPGPHPIGEIYVIGVDPDAQGLGLGRALVLAGLRHLAVDRHCQVAILYVAADNVAALGLYEALGFEIQRTDTALRLAGTGA
jgi:mycothiol synthase